MTQQDPTEILDPAPDERTTLQTENVLDPRQRVLVLGVELAKRATNAKTPDDLYFLLVNDLRTLIEFDRCFLVTHFAGRSGFTAANNQPTLDDKSKVYVDIAKLAPHLRGLDKAILLLNDPENIEFPDEEMSDDLKKGLISYLGSSDCKYFICLPLLKDGAPIGHLMLEFFEGSVPQQFEIIGLISIAPLLASALAEKWLFSRHPEMKSLTDPEWTRKARALKFFRDHLKLIISVTIVALVMFFLFPIYNSVGGEAEIAPWERLTAFCKIDGMIEKVLVTEGSTVGKNQVLAVLDRREQDYSIETAQREVEILTRQAKLLSLESDETPSKLGERQIIELERKKRQAELDFRKWQSQFLDIRSPVPGIVLTKDVESLAGKRMKGGEPFCEIAVPGDLVTEIYVPEDKAVLVKKDQEARIYLNNNPGTGYKLVVTEVSPSAEVVPRLGNVCRVRAKFDAVPPGTKVGMKGVGKIYTVRTNLWSIICHGLLIRWNYLSLYL